MTEFAVEVSGLAKSYGAVRAVDGLSFAVQPGEIFALLGPNGAGKTTTLECIEGLRRPEAGQIRVAGLDPATGGRRLALAMGVQLQSQGLPAGMTPREALGFFARYRGLRPDLGLAERFGLTLKLDTPCLKLSEGQKRRLSLALAVAHRPQVLILDEPTAALDVESRTELHRLVKELKEEGTTIILASHDMAEVEKLADRAGVVIKGRLVASGTPRELRSQAAGQSRLACSTEEGCLLGRAPVLAGAVFAGHEGELAVFHSADPGQAVTDLVKLVTQAGDRILSLQVEGPSLEERFMELVRRNQ